MKSDSKPTDARTRILETAWEMIEALGNVSLTLVDVAQRAGVSRQTVYVNFNNRVGLLSAMVEHKDSTSPQVARLKLVPQDAPAELRLAHVVRNWFEYLPVVFPVARALTLASDGDSDAQAAIQSRWQMLRGGFLALMQSVQREGRLAGGWTPETAADWMYHLTHIDTWHHLVAELQWLPQDVIDRTIESLQMTLLRPIGSGAVHGG
jgi:AcrR family transcriptional regulator